MRFYKQPHAFYCGIDLHARTMYLCVLDHAGHKLLHKEVPVRRPPQPGAFCCGTLNPTAPYAMILDLVAWIGRPHGDRFLTPY